MITENIDQIRSVSEVENNLRLPDAVTILHGPRRLLAQFIIASDRATREMGITLRVRQDFDALLLLNRYESARGNWYPIVDMFNPGLVELTYDNAFWVSGENSDGEIVLTFGTRMFDWRGTSLAEQARALFYGEDRGQPCTVTAEAARRISGIVTIGGVNWVRPDYRGRQISALSPRISKVIACARWPVDWSFAFVTQKHIDRGMPQVWGSAHVDTGISYPGTPWLDLSIVYTSATEIYEDIANFLNTTLSGVSSPQFFADSGVAAPPAVLEHMVTNTSSDGVFQGSSNRS
jgi:hypothetical protein